jgi:hypothetical protein
MGQLVLGEEKAGMDAGFIDVHEKLIKVCLPFSPTLCRLRG